jgi:hypothetical protein
LRIEAFYVNDPNKVLEGALYSLTTLGALGGKAFLGIESLGLFNSCFIL